MICLAHRLRGRNGGNGMHTDQRHCRSLIVLRQRDSALVIIMVQLGLVVFTSCRLCCTIFGQLKLLCDISTHIHAKLATKEMIDAHFGGAAVA